MKKFFLGIDGGGTKTAVCLIDEGKQQVGYATSGPASFDTVSQEVFKKHVEDCLKQLSYDGEIVSCFAGIGGVSSDDDAKVVVQTLKTIPQLTNAIIEAANDVTNALLGGLGEYQGITCIIGTGSVCFGVNDNKTHRCGGYCWQEGDAGSSYDLGRKALQYLAKVIDGRRIGDEFSEDIMKATNCYSFAPLAKYFIDASRTEVAALARIVTRHQNNEVAKNIIENAVLEMVEMVSTVYQKLDFKETFLSVTGSLGNANTYYKEFFRKTIQEKMPLIKIVEGKYEAYYGSSLKAFINYSEVK